MQKVELFYNTINDDVPINLNKVNAFRHEMKRYQTAQLELITRRSWVQIPPPQPKKPPDLGGFSYFMNFLSRFAYCTAGIIQL